MSLLHPPQDYIDRARAGAPPARGLAAGLAGALALLLGAGASAAPAFVTEAGLEPRSAVEREAAAAWRDLSVVWSGAAGGAPKPPREPVRLRRARELDPGRAGRSQPGLVELRQARDGSVDERLVLALRHELAHQLLWSACPAGAGDALFHEAFALATSGELELWSRDDYLPLPQAQSRLERARSLDTRDARAALARLLVEHVAPGGGLPAPLLRRVRQCAADAPWGARMTPAELAERRAGAGVAFVAISRHSGELLHAEGDWRTALPFGSTLKPLLVAGARTPPPRIEPRLDPQWVCGERLPSEVDAPLALLRSCNGYFVDWARREPSIAGFGRYGEALLALGLERLPADVSEAMGLRATLSLTPLAMAHAWRLLAETSPGTLAILERNAREGTLAGLPASPRLSGWATKTGTVRDGSSRPTLGWIVAADADVIAVMAQPGRQPRDFADRMADRLEGLRKLPGRVAARVQSFGLLEPGDVEVRCSGAGFAVRHGAPVRVEGWRRLAELTADGEALCAGGPWLVRFPGLAREREYAGIFGHAPAPEYRTPAGAVATEKAKRARRGSDFVFRTSLALYTAGVLAAEDAAISGEPRAALARVVSHNAGQSRHGTRPVCDTTHCQVFQGTARARPGDEAAIGGSAPAAGWLAFAAGGEEPWREERAGGAVERVLGEGAFSLRFGKGKLTYLRPVASRGGVFEEQVTLGCDAFRSALALPSCPVAASQSESGFVFEGRGRGHGVGLDVDAARGAAGDRDAILRRAYE